MMKIEFKTSGAAFEDEYADKTTNRLYKEQEVLRILESIHYRIEAYHDNHGPIMDTNGNKIGKWSLD